MTSQSSPSHRCVAFAVLLRPVIAGVGAADRRRGGQPGLADEVAELRERMAELEASSSRLQELEERVDFAERVLAKRDEVARLPLQRTPV